MPDIKQAMMRKVGPLPVVAWAGIAIAAFVAYRLLTGGGSKSGQVTIVDAFDPDALPGGSGGGDGGGVIPTPDIPPIGTEAPYYERGTNILPVRLSGGPVVRSNPVTGSGARVAMASISNPTLVPLRLGSAPTISGRTLASPSGVTETFQSRERLNAALRTAATTIRTATNRAISRIA